MTVFCTKCLRHPVYRFFVTKQINFWLLYQHYSPNQLLFTINTQILNPLLTFMYWICRIEYLRKYLVRILIHSPEFALVEFPLSASLMDKMLRCVCKLRWYLLNLHTLCIELEIYMHETGIFYIKVHKCYSINVFLLYFLSEIQVSLGIKGY